MSNNSFCFPDTQIIIFAREPVAGQVKTRLIPTLGKQGATEFYIALLDLTLHKIYHYNLSPVSVCITPESNMRYFSERYPYADLQITTQTGSDLGQRMYYALEQSLKQYSKAILIGTDCPFLDNNDLQHSIKALDSRDMVFSPAKDGGYVLVGARQLLLGSFDNIEWGTEQVMKQTRHRLTELNICWQELSAQHDIDNEDDLKYLLQHIHKFSESGSHILDIFNRYS